MPCYNILEAVMSTNIFTLSQAPEPDLNLTSDVVCLSNPMKVEMSWKGLQEECSQRNVHVCMDRFSIFTLDLC
jgi:hypothetical protein